MSKEQRVTGRREFLKQSAATTGALTFLGGSQGQEKGKSPKNCIFLFLTGGPSQLDTFDPKPNAPEEIRGPFKAIQTKVPGMLLSETLPEMAARANRFCLVRSLNHQEAPIHETGQQLLQTGRLASGSLDHPHFGAIISSLAGGGDNAMAPFVVLPGKLGNTGVTMYQGQDAGYLGEFNSPVVVTSSRKSFRDIQSIQHPSPRRNASAVRSTLAGIKPDPRYGSSLFGEACQAARALVEKGTRFALVNMFETVFNEPTWDCHADGGALSTTLQDYRTRICPMFDLAFSALLDDLEEKGLLASTLVVAVGEFGRTPYLNNRGGRDHHNGVWTGILAGAGLAGGAIIGSSDDHGDEPKDQPVSPGMLAATIFKTLGYDPASLVPGTRLPLADANPIAALA
ncbi:MAG: DUF1501 domain-containing protein [Gemmataceae bacterium]|nr:DUF1501 domain-containing protein [Gemmataceae bacterium]